MKQRTNSLLRVALACLVLLAAGYVSESPVRAREEPAGLPSPSDPARYLTLNDALRLALANNPELRAAGGRVTAAAGRAYQAKLWSNPELELSAEDWPVNNGRGFSDAKQTVGIAQSLPFPGKKKLDRRIGVSGVRLSEAQLSLRRLELVRDVKTAFYQVLATERFVAVEEELVALAESSASTARKRVAAGAAPEQEQLRAEIPLEQARTERSGFQRDLMSARQTLALLLGRPDLAEATLSGALAESVTQGLLDHEPERWLTNHPSFVAARTERDRTWLERRRARLEPYPDVKVAVGGGRIGETDQSIIQLGLSVPLPILDRGKGKKQEAQANVSIAESELASVEQRLLWNWRTATQRLRTAGDQVANYRERILPKANEALRLVQTGFEQGKFSFIDLLDTQRTTAEVRLTYQQKLLELNFAQAELESLLGLHPVELKSGPAIQPERKP